MAARAHGRQVELLASLAAACLGRTLLPRERVAVDLALATVGAARPCPTLPAVVEAMLEPTAEVAATIRTDRTTLLEDGRDVALELRRLVHGDLRGMFDGPTTAGLDLSGPLVVLDLSALYNSAALGVLMACATAWLQAALARQAAAGRTPGDHVLVVVDEAWAVLANLGVARWLQASWKLSRAYGVANVAVLHRLSDLQAVGAAGSEQVGLARGLCCRTPRRGSSTPSRPVRWTAPASCSRCRRPRRSCCPSFAGGWRCGRSVAGRSWSSTFSVRPSASWWTPTRR